MPEWMREALIGLGAFTGGRVLSIVGDRMKEAERISRCVDRLTVAVEHMSEDLRQIKTDIHEQLDNLKIDIDSKHDHHETRINDLERRTGLTKRSLD